MGKIPRAMTAPTVDFSIVVPTYNRPFGLEGCLSALAALVYPFSQVAPRQWPSLATLLFSWQGMNLAGFMVEAARSLAVRPHWLPRSP